MDYQKGKKFKYGIILLGSLLNEDANQLSESEVIEKIKENEEKKSFKL